MPQQPAKQQTSPAKSAKPNRNEKSPDAMPGDMRSMGQDTGNRKAQRNATSEHDSVLQQAGKKLDDQSDQQSVTVPIQELQEPKL